MAPPLSRYSSFDEQMNKMLDIIEQKIDLIKPLCQKYYCEFSCAIFICYDNGESTPSIHLNSRYNRILKDLDIEFDLDLYCLSNDNSKKLVADLSITMENHTKIQMEQLCLHHINILRVKKMLCLLILIKILCLNQNNKHVWN